MCRMWLDIIICVLVHVNLGWSTTWKINLNHEPFNMTYVDSKKFNHDSVITCVAYCMSDSSLITASFQDGVCYCLSDMPNSSLNQIRLTSIIEKLSGPSECELKGYQIYENLSICLKLNTTEVVWDAAYDICHEDGGYLLNINTDEIFSALEQLTTVHGVDRAYIGGYGNIPNGFEWSRGGQIKTEYWNSDEPDNFKGSENCVSYYHGSGIGLYDGLCTEKQPFICELLL